MATKKRLIDADELMLSIRTTIARNKAKYANNPIISSVLDGFDELVMGKVKNSPTVDAVEVVHGHMVERIVDHECPWYTIYDCSECGCSVERWHRYCPNCGAKMDGDSNA